MCDTPFKHPQNLRVSIPHKLALRKQPTAQSTPGLSAAQGVQQPA
jgi:hypothetical protein